MDKYRIDNLPGGYTLLPGGYTLLPGEEDVPKFDFDTDFSKSLKSSVKQHFIENSDIVKMGKIIFPVLLKLLTLDGIRYCY